MMAVAAFDTSILFVEERGWRAAAAAEATVASSIEWRFSGGSGCRFWRWLL